MDSFRSSQYLKTFIGLYQYGPDRASYMKLFEATIRTPDGREFKDRVGADTAQAARFLLQQRYGPRAVPYLPKMIPG